MNINTPLTHLCRITYFASKQNAALSRARQFRFWNLVHAKSRSAMSAFVANAALLVVRPDPGRDPYRVDPSCPALGQKQTLGKVRLMSALPPKADIT